MLNRKFAYSTLILLISLALILLAIISQLRREAINVTFLDVGQGDSILISRGSQQVLIDGGKDGKLLLEKLGGLIPFWDRQIELIVQTHPDADHIGGLIEIFKTYKVASVLKTKMQSQSQTFKALEEAIAHENSDIIEAASGQKIIFSNSAEARVLFPFGSVQDAYAKDTNASSVVLKLNFGLSSFLFVGDLPSEQEKEILAKNIDIKATVLKVSHHGSKYSSSAEFLQRVSPRDAIISVGRNNSYGHPGQETLQRLLGQKASVFRTDEIGDITYQCQNPNSKCQKKN